jgi:hypothetical protein
MTVDDIVKEAVQLFGFPNIASAPQRALDRILNDINSAIQKMADSGEDFFSREELGVRLLAETESYVLPKNIMTVLKPARLDDGTILTELTSRGQLYQFGQVFLGELTNETESGRPMAYFVEPLKDTSDATGDSVKTVVHVAPKPLLTAFSAGTSFMLLNVLKEPTLVTAGQMVPGPGTILEVPHKFVESVFLPILRWNLSGSYLFQDKDKKPQIDAEYEQALKLFSRSDPRGRSKPEESNVAALETGGRQRAA